MRFSRQPLEWVAISFSRGSSQPRDWTQVSCTAGRFFTEWATRKAPYNKLVVFSCVCKNNWFCSFQKEKFLSLRSISNHALTIIQRLSQCLPSPESPGFLNCCSLPGSSKEVIIHDASLPPKSLGLYLMLPSWEPKEVTSLLFYQLG